MKSIYNHTRRSCAHILEMKNFMVKNRPVQISMYKTIIAGLEIKHFMNVHIRNLALDKNLVIRMGNTLEAWSYSDHICCIIVFQEIVVPSILSES